jgi:TonB family protein
LCHASHGPGRLAALVAVRRVRSLREDTMRLATSFGLALLIGMTTVGCGNPPADEIAGARSALERATASAGKDATDSLKAAQSATAALEAEVAVQEAKWFKSYDRTKELAAAAMAASDKAVADAAAARERAATAAAARTKAAAEARAALLTSAVRVGGNIRNPVKVKNVAPEYPAIAKSARVGGVVQIEATIGPDGKVHEAEVTKSVPLLDQAALTAVKQWEYRPTMVKGVAVPVTVNVAVDFRP